MARVNRQITLAARPVGYPKLSDFELSFAPLQTPARGEVLLRSVYLSLDPFIRLRMSSSDGAAPAIALGEVIDGSAVALVVESKDANFRAGDAVEGLLGWREYSIARGSQLRKLDPSAAPISTALGATGWPGLTAYFGMLDVARPQPGETTVISGAAGAVGMFAGQIAKLAGSRVVGVASSDVEVSWLCGELGFDAAINFSRNREFDRQLAAACGRGIDVYFDIVGGETTDAVVRRINPGARIALCGQTSQYNLERPEKGPRWLQELIAKQARVEGFLASGYGRRLAAGRRKLAKWLREGKLKYREEIAHGLEAAPQAFLSMLQGKNMGKQLVQLSEKTAAGSG